MQNRFLESRYDILQQLGNNGFEADYLVTHRQLGETCRVKVRPHGLGDPGRRQLFERRLPWITRLEHPGVVPIYDIQTVDDAWAIIEMEALSGSTLDSLMVDAGARRTGAAMPVLAALSLADQVLDAVAYLHDAGWIHGSLAPDRFILVRRSGAEEARLMLADPGFGRLLGAAERTTAGGLLMERLRYSPPEHFLGEERDATISGDVYALGLVLYELLTGRFPIAGTNPTSLAAGHLLRPILPFHESDEEGRIPAAIRAAVERCLAKKPEERYPDVTSLRLALEEGRPPSPATEQQVIDLWLEDEDPAATRPGMATRDLTEVERKARSRHLLEQARTSLAEEDPAAARRLLREAQSIDPDDAHVTHLLREVEKAERERRLRQEQERQVEVTGREVEGLLAVGNWRSARAKLMNAVERFGGGDELRELRRRVDEAERKELETRPQPPATSSALQVDELVERARQLSQTEDLDRAKEALQEALSLDPAHVAARTLSESLQALMVMQEGENKRQESLEQRIESIRGLLEGGDPGAAMAQLQQAVSRFGDRRELQELRYQIAEGFLNADLGRSPLPPPPALPRREPAPSVPPPVPSPAQTLLEEAPPASPPEMPSPRAATPTVDGISLVGLGSGSEPPAAEPALGPDQGVAMARRSPWSDLPVWLLILVAMVLMAFLGYWMATRGSAPAVPEPKPALEAEDVLVRGSGAEFPVFSGSEDLAKALGRAKEEESPCDISFPRC